jgi:hypothetical protein
MIKNDIFKTLTQNHEDSFSSLIKNEFVAIGAWCHAASVIGG